MRLIHTALFAAVAAVALTACNKPAETTTPEPTPATDTAPAADAAAAANDAPPAMTSEAHANHTAMAELAPTQGNNVKGNVTFSVVDGKVHVKGAISGLKPNSEHGFHIHEKGDCSAADASSAGGHFNPTSDPHGKVGTPTHHAGDMNNIVANADGVAQVNVHAQGPVLGGGAANDALGRAVIVHADGDDYTSQPSGNAGARVACGVITAG